MPKIGTTFDIALRIGPVEVRITNNEPLDDLRSKRDTLAETLKKIDEEIQRRSEEP